MRLSWGPGVALICYGCLGCFRWCYQRLFLLLLAVVMWC